MSRSLILDTNVFYNLGSGALTTAKFAAPADELFYSPLSVLELAGHWRKATHQDRRRAAHAILSSGAKELLEPDAFITKRFGYPLAEPSTSFLEGVRAMATSNNMTELTDGVRDYVARVSRSVNLRVANSWRVTVGGKWAANMLALQKELIPGFSDWYSADPKKRKGPVPKLKGREKQHFLSYMQSPEWSQALLLACQERAFLGAKRGRHLLPTPATVTALVGAIVATSAYCAVYTQYVIRLMTEGALAEPNDSGDLEFFLYSVDDDHVVVTSEKKWKMVAARANFSHRVLLV
jgi:hypothetical protein